jgi:DNA protecting protein DprA
MTPETHGAESRPQPPAGRMDGAWHAALLAVAESRPDGWAALPAELESQVRVGTDTGELATLLTSHAGLSVRGDRQAQWARRLAQLLAARPALRIVDVTDPDYPANLRRVPGRPVLLFVEGKLLEADRHAVAIVGSRHASATGLRAAAETAAGLVKLGFTIVSGLAKGIDSAAHNAALDAGGRTIAVIGTGIDRVFPEENAKLTRRIRSQGALISQFPPGQGPTKTTFPARNAVIAGLSLGSVLIEAKKWSGSRIETDRSLEQGRPVFVWASVMAHQPWVTRFASTPGVHLVESVEQVATILTNGRQVDRRGAASDH